MGKMVLMLSPDGELAQVDESLVAQAKAKGAKAVNHNARLLAKYADTIPAITGFGGGIVGLLAGGGTTAGAAAIPGALAGSAIGGGVGEAARIEAYRALGLPTPSTPGQYAGQVGHEAGLQGILGGLGEVPAMASRLIGRGFLTSAIKPGSEAALNAAESGRVAVGRPLTPWGKTGGEQISSNTARPAAELRGALAGADASGTLISRDALLARAWGLEEKAAKVPGSNIASRKLEQMRAVFESKYPEWLTPSQAQEVKRLADEELYAGQKLAKIRGAGSKLTATQGWNEAVGNDARGQLSSIPTYGPQISAANAQLSPQMRLLQDVQKAEGLNPRAGMTPAPQPFSLGGIRGTDLALAAAGGSGRVASRVGLGLTNPYFLMALRNTPRGAMLLQQLSQDPRAFQNMQTIAPPDATAP